MKRGLSPCRTCKALTNHRSGYCEAHRSQGWERQQAGRSASQRGYGAAWRRMRAAVLARDSYLCQSCKRHGRVTEAHEVDHKRARAHGGTDDPANLEAICRSCHRRKTASEGRARRG